MQSAKAGASNKIDHAPPEVMVVSQLVEAFPDLFQSPGAVRNQVMRRKIPFRKVNGRLVFLRREILRWIESAPGLRVEQINE